MFINLIILVVSIAALILAAEKLVEFGVFLAKKWGVSNLTIGLTIVSIGTSLPEVVASGFSSLRGHPEIAVGNVIGSNICNIGLILGLPGLFAAINCKREIILREGAVMLIVSVLVWSLGLYFTELSALQGLGLLALFGAFIYWVFRSSREEIQKAADVSAQSFSEEQAEAHGPEEDESSVFLLTKFIASLIVLIVSADFLVQSTVDVARALEVSENIIAISLIALGTSLPELSVSFAAVKRGQGDMLVGNILGSNIANLLLVFGVSAVVTPVPFSVISLTLDFPLMLLFSLLMVLFLYHDHGISRPRAGLLLTLYIGVIIRCLLMPM